MRSDEIRKMSDIVEGFALINNDINTVYDKMSELVGARKEFKKWKKNIKGHKNTKKDYFDYDTFLEDSSWYVKNYYGMYNNHVYGFTFLIFLDYNDGDDKYTTFIQKLNRDNSLNLKVPLLCIYGAYEPCNTKNISFSYWSDEDNGWY